MDHPPNIESPQTRWQNGLSRITPRTCLWPLAGSLVVTFGLSIGLTFRSDHHCYAGTCGEWLFPLQARLHIVVWYTWISILASFLAVRAFHPEMQKALSKSLIRHEIPVIRKQISIAAALMLVWIVLLYSAIIGIWWVRLRDYFVDRGEAGGVFKGGNRLAAIALTGHFCDVTMGMVLIPISRHSALASFFKLSVSTTLTLHVMTAYTLFGLTIIHGLLYASWVPLFRSFSKTLRSVYPLLNPTYLDTEVWPGNTSSLGVWRASLIFSGIFTSILMLAIFLSTLPTVRSKHFNLFYFTHFLSIVIVIIICLHASTMFYCTAPGLAMWSLDWGMRLYELRKTLSGRITTIGNGWYWYVCNSTTVALYTNLSRHHSPFASSPTQRLLLSISTRPFLHPPLRLLPPRIASVYHHHSSCFRKFLHTKVLRSHRCSISLSETR